MIMNKKWLIPGIIVGIVVIIGLMFMGSYNSLVGQREQESGTVSIRLRTGDQESGIPLEVFAARVLEKIQTKSLDL